MNYPEAELSVYPTCFVWVPRRKEREACQNTACLASQIDLSGASPSGEAPACLAIAEQTGPTGLF